MRTSEKFQVGKREFQVNLWSPAKAMENLAWLTKLAGEPLVSLFVQADSVKELMESELDLKALTPGLRNLFISLDEKVFVLKTKEFTEGLLCDGAKVEYDTYFMGRPGRLIKVIAHVLKVQYADFFDDDLDEKEA